MTAPAFTHVACRLSSVGYVPHHHRDTPKGKRHAVLTTPGNVYDGARLTAICGESVYVQADERIFDCPLTCTPCTDPLYVTCKDCRKKLGLVVAKKR